jgi:hypothetical protein
MGSSIPLSCPLGQVLWLPRVHLSAAQRNTAYKIFSNVGGGIAGRSATESGRDVIRGPSFAPSPCREMCRSAAGPRHMPRHDRGEAQSAAL